MSCHLSYYLSSQLSLSGVLILCIASRIPVVPNELYPLSTVVDCVVQSFVFVLVNSSCVISCCMGPILNKYLRLSYELLEPALGARSANPSINEYLRGIALYHLLSMYHTLGKVRVHEKKYAIQGHTCDTMYFSLTLHIIINFRVDTGDIIHM